MEDIKNESIKKATFAGGCFWCMVKPFDQYEGIISVTSGYTGGVTENPTYEEVSTDQTGHYEAVQIIYDETLFTYDDLLQLFWQQIDPTDAAGQFGDRGNSYKTAVFYHDEKQKQLAEQSKQSLIESNRFQAPIVTEILPAKPFYRAEEEHQDYYKKSTNYYRRYREASGRDMFINKHWGEDK